MEPQVPQVLVEMVVLVVQPEQRRSAQVPQVPRVRLVTQGPQGPLVLMEPQASMEPPDRTAPQELTERTALMHPPVLSDSMVSMVPTGPPVPQALPVSLEIWDSTLQMVLQVRLEPLESIPVSTVLMASPD